MYTIRSIQRLILTLTMSLLLTGSLWACPTCKEGMNSNEPEKNNMARGYAYSVMFMLSMPPTIILGLGVAFYFECKKAKREKEEALIESSSETAE
jgi:heme/copper-type cytochrome/quinol oxidase subunit 2